MTEHSVTEHSMTKHTVTKAFTAMSIVVAVLALLVPPASAHDPIFLSADQTTPDTGPFMPDGTISWALYGSVLEAGDTRGFEFDLRDGDELYISLLIPNREPEVELPDADLPTVELEWPDGSTRTVVPEVRETFDEPFSNTSYITLAELREPGQAGRYRGTVLGAAPSRFTIAIGETEIFFSDTERSGERPANFMEISGPLNEWYSTPPGGESVGDLVEGEAEVQLDLIEEAMESGEGQAPAGAFGEDTEAATNEAGEATDDAEPELEPADDESEVTIEEAVSDTTESASAIDASSDGSSATWIAPVVVLAIGAVGAGAYFVRRRTGGETSAGR